MNVKEYEGLAPVPEIKNYMTEEQSQKQVDYYRGLTVAKKMLDDGMLTLSQYDNFCRKLREKISPLAAEIL